MSNMIKSAIISVLKEALRRETEAFNYYYRAGRNASFPETESLFIQLSEEERKHRLFILKELDRIKQILDIRENNPDNEKNRILFSMPDKLFFKKMPAVKGLDMSAISLPAELIGGDYFDIAVLDANESDSILGVFLFDVMGHGMEATHLKARAKRFFGHLHETWLKGKCPVDLFHPREVMENLNQNLSEYCLKCERFISAFYGVFNLNTMQLIYTSAGHDTPVMIHSSGQYKHLDETQLLLGVDHKAAYDEVKVQINSGDVLTLFSDGVTEVFNQHEEMFERKRLAGVIEKNRKKSTEEIVTKIMNVLQLFAGDMKFIDDLTLVVFKIG